MSDIQVVLTNPAFFIPLAAVLAVLAFDFVVGGYIFKSAAWREFDADRFGAAARDKTFEPAREFLGRTAWGVSTVSMFVVLMAATAAAVYVGVSWMPLVAGGIFFAIAVVIGIVVYPLPVVPLTDRLIRSGLPTPTADRVIVYKNLLAGLSAFVLVLTIGATCGTLLPAEAGTVADRIGNLKLLLLIHSVALIAAVLNTYATHALPAMHMPDGEDDELALYGGGVALYVGGTQTLYLAAIYLPALLILQFGPSLVVSGASGGLAGEVETGANSMVLELVTVLGPAAVGGVSALFGRRRFRRPFTERI